MSFARTKPAHIVIKNILVAVDFSGLSDRAMDWAVSFARRYDSTLIAAHVISPALYASSFAASMYEDIAPLPYLDGVRRELKYRLEELANNAVDSGVKCIPQLVEGAIAEQLRSVAEAYSADLSSWARSRTMEPVGYGIGRRIHRPQCQVPGADDLPTSVPTCKIRGIIQTHRLRRRLQRGRDPRGFFMRSRLLKSTGRGSVWCMCGRRSFNSKRARAAHELL